MNWFRITSETYDPQQFPAEASCCIAATPGPRFTNSPNITLQTQLFFFDSHYFKTLTTFTLEGHDIVSVQHTHVRAANHKITNGLRKCFTRNPPLHVIHPPTLTALFIGGQGTPATTSPLPELPQVGGATERRAVWVLDRLWGVSQNLQHRVRSL